MRRSEWWLVCLAIPGVLALGGCEGDKGPRGEQGPPGEDGTAGDEGPAGADGTDGDDGTPGEDGAEGPAGQDGAEGADGINVGTLAGTVVDAETGLAVVGATVSTDPASDSATTDASGAFEIADVVIGVYTVVVSATGYGTQSFPGASVTAGQTFTLDIEIVVPAATTGDVTGRVGIRSEDDDPLVDGTVALVDAFALAASDSAQPLEDLAAVSPYTAQTGANGSYTIEGVTPGRYYIHVVPAVADVDDVLPGGGASRESFEVEAGATVTLDVVVSQRPSPGATFIGSTTCLTCHTGLVAQTDMSGWRETLHSLIHRQPGVATANQDLSGYPNHDLALTFFVDGNSRDNTGAGDGLGLRITQAGFSAFPANMNLILGYDGRYFMIFENSATSVRSMRYYAEFTFGGHGVYKERWVTRVNTDGSYDSSAGGASSYYILPVQFDEALQAGVEPFHPYNASNWGPPVVADGPAVRPAQNKSFDNNCSGCHFTGTTLTRDGEGNFHADGVNTAAGQLDYDGDGALDELDIGCEDCHGPGSEHTAGGMGIGKRIVMPSLLSAERDALICGRCHTRGTGNGTIGVDHTEFPSRGADAALELPQPGYVDHEEFVTAFHTDNPGVYADDVGHSRQHHQQYVDMMKSTHYRNPYRQLSCSDCHNMHNRDNGPSLTASADDNSLCLGCHAEFPFGLVGEYSAFDEGDAIAEHMTEYADMTVGYDPRNLAAVGTATATGGAGQCATCHMPKTAASQSRFVHETVNASGQPSGPRIRGDISSHIFDYVSPSDSQVLFNAGGNNNRMPNSCGSCHNDIAGIDPNYAY